MKASFFGLFESSIGISITTGSGSFYRAPDLPMLRSSLHPNIAVSFLSEHQITIKLLENMSTPNSNIAEKANNITK
jgi:hypothetical protein